MYSMVNISDFFSLRAQSCMKDLQSRLYIKIKTIQKSKKGMGLQYEKVVLFIT